jgi:O-antigen/teichoic acid export membrane protein
LKIDKLSFTVDYFLNLGSVILLGISGVIINILIVRFYTASDLGVFNQIYAVYVLFSQLAVIGVQISVLKHIAQFSDKKQECNVIITTALVISLVSASVATVLLFLLRNIISWMLESSAVGAGLIYILPGLWCFALNKVYLSILNGFQKMRAYAFFSSLRAMGLLFCILVAVSVRIDGYKLPFIFTAAELVTLIFIASYTHRIFSLDLGEDYRGWIRKHLNFGLKSVSIGLVTELNTRVDVLILGIFTSDRVVGIYSLAAILIEGVYQLPFVLRKMFDPILTKLVHQFRLVEVQNLVRRGAAWTFFGALLVFGALVALFPHAVKMLTDNQDFKGSWIILCILAIGAVVESSYIPFSGLLVQGGYPGFQSLFILSTCLTNVALNFLLIPYYGMFGAAVATTISYILFVAFLKSFAYRLFEIRI